MSRFKRALVVGAIAGMTVLGVVAVPAPAAVANKVSCC